MAQARGGTWTAELDARLRALWGEGLSGVTIGARLGVSKNAVIGRARRLRLPARPSPLRAPALDAAVRAEVRRQRDAGESYAAIARALGISRSAAGAIGRRGRPRQGAAGVAAARAAMPARGAGPVAAARTGSQRGAVGGEAEAQVRPTAPVGTVATPRHDTPMPRAAAHGAAQGGPAPALRCAGTPLGAGRRCQWPLWPDGAGPDHPAYGSFCGCARVRGSYCAEHGARAYVRVAA